MSTFINTFGLLFPISLVIIIIGLLIWGQVKPVKSTRKEDVKIPRIWEVPEANIIEILTMIDNGISTHIQTHKFWKRIAEILPETKDVECRFTVCKNSTVILIEEVSDDLDDDFEYW